MTKTNPTKTDVQGLSSIACVTVDVPLTGMDLLILAAHVKGNADATIAQMKAATDVDAALVVATMTNYADNTDAMLLWLHTAYELALDALHAARMAAGGEFRNATRGGQAHPLKVTR